MGKYSDQLLGSAPAAAPAPAQGKYSAALLGAPEQPQAAPQPVETTRTGDFLRGAGDVAMLGFADEAEAAIRAMGSDKTYAQALKDVRAKHEAAGPAFYAGMAAGTVVPGLGIAGAAARGTTLAAKLGRAALGGGVSGAVGGFGAGEGGLPGEEGELTERLPSAAIGAGAGAVLGPLGERAGAGLTKLAQRKMVKDIERLNPAAMQGLRQKAQQQGIDLTPAELTNLPSLKAQQKALGNLPQSGDDLAAFYEGRAGGQIEPAVDRFLENISPIEGAEVAGLHGRAAAQGAMDAVAANRAAQAAPLYKQAFETAPPIDTTPVVDLIDQELKMFPQEGEVFKKLTKAKNLLMRSQIEPQFRNGRQVSTAARLTPETRLPNLHSAKVEIGQMLDVDKLGATTKSRLVKVRNSLRDQLENASPDYATATGIYGDLSPGVERVREGVAGIIADLSDPNARLAASKLFNPATSGPLAVREAKGLLQKQDPQAWQGLKRAWLEEQWIKAGKETLAGGPKVNRGALFRKALLGDLKQRKILQQALEPDEFGALSDLSEVLEASGRVKSIGSDTAWNQELMRVQRKSATNPVSRLMRFATPDGLKQLAEVWDERRLASQSEQLVKVITSPQGVEIMRELKKLPVSARFRRAVLGQMMAQMGTAGVNEGMNP